ncbi:MAG: carboxypeptidase regulatory-like domain-containing protein [Planctomycetes bacterium]|nr:carboxypeptidase regulatory-like domain-containing protein [Planctomycetota bacterium]
MRAHTSAAVAASRRYWQLWVHEHPERAARFLLACALLQLLMLAFRSSRAESAPEPLRERAALSAPAAEPKSSSPLAPRAAQQAPTAAAVPSAERSSEEVFGRVVDLEGRPLAARVVLRYADGRHLEGQGDEDGRFRFPAVEAGDISVEALHPGHRTLRRDAAPRGTEIVLELARGSGLRGRVVDLSGRPVSGAFVEARGSAGYLELRRTDEDGRYEIPRPASGMLSFTVASAGHDLLETSRVPVRVEDEQLEDWVLREGISFAIRVVDAASGAPIAGARITRQPAGRLSADDLRRRAFPLPGVTGKDGTYHCDGLPRAGVILGIAAHGFAPVAQTLHIDESVRGEQRFALDRGRVVRGRIQARGGVRAGWVLSLEQLTELGQWTEVGARATSDAAGRFELTGAPVDRPLRVIVWQGRVRAKISEQLEPGGDGLQELLLELE